MQLGSLGKLIIATVVVICLTVLLAVNAVSAEAGMPPITLIVGYIIGNGVTSRSGQGVQSIIEPKPQPIE